MRIHALEMLAFYTYNCNNVLSKETFVGTKILCVASFFNLTEIILIMYSCFALVGVTASVLFSKAEAIITDDPRVQKTGQDP